MSKVPRRLIAEYIAEQLVAGKPRARLLRELAAYLVDTKRTREAELIVRDIEAGLLDRGLAYGSVTSAAKLSAALRTNVESYVKRATGAKRVELAEMIDPSVIGGVRVELPGQLFDTTVRRKLDILQMNGRQ